jgi:putative aldouronate transport system substrate-binding protein
MWYSESAAGEKARLMLMGAEDMPDIFMNSINRYEVVEYSDQNVFRPVDDLIEQWMPNLQKVYEMRPEYQKAAVSPDGKMYGFPYIEEMHGLVLSPGPIYIYKPWLDKLNLAMPQTLDEFRRYLELVRDADMNDNGLDDEIPLTFQVGGWDSYEGYHQIISCFGISDIYNHLSVVNGKVVNTTTLPEFKLGIDYVNMMFRDGLIDEEAFMPAMSGDPRARIIGILGERDVRLGAVQLFDRMGEIPGNEQRRSEYVALPRLTGPNGAKQGIRYNASEASSVTRCVITTNCRYPEAAARWIDTFFEPEQSVYLNWGTEGYVYEKDENGILRWDLDEDGKPNLKEGYESMSEMRWASTPVSGALAILTEYYETVVEYPLDAELIIQGQRDAGLEEILEDREYLPPMWMLSSEIEKLAQLETYVNNIVNAHVTKWLMEGGVNEDWDTYQQALKDAQIDEVMAIYQAAYDRHLSQMNEQEG